MMNNKLLVTISLAAIISGCGGNSSDGGGSSSGGAPTNGVIISTSGTVPYSSASSFNAVAGHAYSAELTPVSGNVDLFVGDHDTTTAFTYGDNYTWSMNPDLQLDTVSFIATSSSKLFAFAEYAGTIADFTLKVYNNHLVVDGASLRRKTYDSDIHFSFDAVAGQAYNVTATPLSGDLALEVTSNTLADSMFGFEYPYTPLTGSSDVTGQASENVVFVADQTKTYYFTVSNLTSGSNADFTAQVRTTTISPDLRVKVDKSFYDNGNLTVYYTVSNIGLADSTGVSLKFWLNSASVPSASQTANAEIAVDPIAVGSSYSGSTTINAGSLTSGTLWAYVDPYMALTEADETNNVSVELKWHEPIASYSFEDGQIPAAFSASWQIEPADASSGTYSLRSAPILDGELTCASLTVANSSAITFDWKVSSDPYDRLTFYINSVSKAEISGTQDWSRLEFTFSQGTRTFDWCYKKSAAGVAGADAGWIDNIQVY